MTDRPEETTMTEPTDDPYATVERVSVTTDGGTNGRGLNLVVHLTPEKRAELWAWALENRTL